MVNVVSYHDLLYNRTTQVPLKLCGKCLVIKDAQGVHQPTCMLRQDVQLDSA